MVSTPVQQLRERAGVVENISMTKLGNDYYHNCGVIVCNCSSNTTAMS